MSFKSPFAATVPFQIVDKSKAIIYSKNFLPPLRTANLSTLNDVTVDNSSSNTKLGLEFDISEMQSWRTKISPVWVGTNKNFDFCKLEILFWSVLFLFSTATDFCSARPCENGGKCTNEADDFRCNCTEQWTGKNCSVGRYYLLFAVTFYQFTVLHCSQKVSFT